MSTLEGDEEEVKKGKGLKILTPNNLLTSFPTLLAQIKTGNNSNKLKNEVRQILYLLYQHNKTTKNVYNNVITNPKTFYFNFDWTKDVDENLKHEIELIIKRNGSLAKNKIKSEID